MRRLHCWQGWGAEDQAGRARSVMLLCGRYVTREPLGPRPEAAASPGARGDDLTNGSPLHMCPEGPGCPPARVAAVLI